MVATLAAAQTRSHNHGNIDVNVNSNPRGAFRRMAEYGFQAMGSNNYDRSNIYAIFRRIQRSVGLTALFQRVTWFFGWRSAEAAVEGARMNFNAPDLYLYDG